MKTLGIIYDHFEKIKLQEDIIRIYNQELYQIQREHGYSGITEEKIKEAEQYLEHLRNEEI